MTKKLIILGTLVAAVGIGLLYAVRRNRKRVYYEN